ncbi:hypothetical protein ACFFKU_06860 [Kineococcus gynurae]|uniref:Uncharacterized protein n=1 Tax=Kineococcus gynurae TaxID=452979 RepID=A0ABV5LWY4_9ACTN
MPEFIYAKHPDIDGVAYLARTALDSLPGWEECEKPDPEERAQVRAEVNGEETGSAGPRKTTRSTKTADKN